MSIAPHRERRLVVRQARVGICNSDSGAMFKKGKPATLLEAGRLKGH